MQWWMPGPQNWRCDKLDTRIRQIEVGEVELMANGNYMKLARTEPGADTEEPRIADSNKCRQETMAI